MKKWIHISCICLLSVCLFSCNKDTEKEPSKQDPIMLTIGTPTATATSADIPVTAIRYGSVEIAEFGVMYSAMNPLPTKDDYDWRRYYGPAKVREIWLTDVLQTSMDIDRLSPHTTYYIRAYVETTSGEFYYSKVTSFTTEKLAGLTHTIADFLGFFSCKAYNWDYSEAESWDNVKFENVKGPDGKNNWVRIHGIIWGKEGIDAYGAYDSDRHCIRLVSTLHDKTKSFTLPEWHKGDTTFYAVFYAECIENNGKAYNLVDGQGYDNAAEAWLTIDESGKITYGPANYDDKNGRRANAMKANLYYFNNEVYYTRTSIYEDVTFTRISNQ